MDESISLMELECICNKVITNYTQHNQTIFADKINNVITSFSITNDSFLNRLLTVSKSNVFPEVLCCFQNGLLCQYLQLKILRFYDFLIQGCSKKEELQIMFDNNFTNKMMEFKFDMRDCDIQRAFLFVLKGISMKFSIMEKEWIYDEKKHSCLLFTLCIKNIRLEDSVVTAASRMVLLNLCLFKDVNILENCYDLQNSKKYFKKLLEAFDEESFEFIMDLMNVAPKRLNDIIISVFEKKFNVSDKRFVKQFNIDFFIKTLCYLSNSPMRPIIRKTLKNNVLDMPMNEVSILGILLFSFENNLLFLDDVINMGIINTDNLRIEKLIDAPKEEIKTRNNYQTMEKINKYFLSSLNNLNNFDLMSHILIIHILEKVYTKIPKVIKIYLNKLLELMIKYNGDDIKITYFIEHLLPQRCELDYITSPANTCRNQISTFYKFAIVLTEIEIAFSHWSHKTCDPFLFEHIESEFTSYSVDQNQPRIKMSKSKISIGDKYTHCGLLIIFKVQKKKLN